MSNEKSNIEESFKNSDWSSICAELMPHFNDYLARHSKNVFECEQVNTLDHVFTVPALYDDMAGVRKQVIVPMKIFTRGVDAAVEDVKKATADANTAAGKANDAAASVTQATTDIAAERKKVDEAVAESKTATDAAQEATSDVLASKTAIEENESARQTAETDRANAEAARVAAEDKRETDFSASKDACDDATAKANSTYSHPPYVDRDGYYYKWNVTTSSYDKTDVNLTGKAFQIKKVFASVSAMNATDVNTFAENDFILINTVDVEDADNAKLYVVALDEQGQKFYSYLVDMSGFRGFTGKTPQFIIGNVTTLAEDADAAASISSSGTDTDGNPVYKLNLGIPIGKRLRFADLTDSDKAELMKPATDAAAESKTQTAACKTATDNANTAAIKATTAATNADTATAAANTATAAANTATTNANTAATKAGEATEASKAQTALANELNEHPQKQGDNGNWWKWNTTTKMYEDTGIPAKGGMLYPSMWIDGNALYLEDNESSAASHLSYDGNALYLVI